MEKPLNPKAQRTAFPSRRDSRQYCDSYGVKSPLSSVTRFRRLVYLGLGEEMNRELFRRRSHGCHGEWSGRVLRSKLVVGATQVANKTAGLNITE